MKNRIKGILLSTLLLLIIGLAGTWESVYTRKDCTVIGTYGDEVIAEDLLGYTWSWYVDANSDIMVGDKVTLIMDNANTSSNIFDDIVRGCKVQR